MKKSIPLGRGWSLALDSAEIIPDDPGAGTPAMVYGPFGKSATFGYALAEGMVYDGKGEEFDIPVSVYRKLEAAGPEVDEFLGGEA